MKKSPTLLAFFLILITFFRVSNFLSIGIRLGYLGTAFAFAVAAGVFVAGYFSALKDISIVGRIIAIVLLLAFGVTDLFFNELEVIRSLAPETLIGNGSNFLSMDKNSLTALMHIGAVAWGALPTLLAGGLGLLAAQAEKVASLNKRSWISAALMAISATFTKGIKANLEERYHIGQYRQITSGNSGKALTVSDDEVIDADLLPEKVRWEDLLATDKEAIAAMNGNQIVAKWKVSPRTARNWKSWVVNGKK